MIIGAKTWVLAGGHIPLESRGREPARTSRDELAFLNTSSQKAAVEMTVFYADRDPIGPYRLEIGGRRQRTVRINDLVDPLPVPLDVDYALIVSSSIPIIVQALRIDTSLGLTITALSMYALGESLCLQGKH
jgi:hypothetical protein